MEHEWHREDSRYFKVTFSDSLALIFDADGLQLFRQNDAGHQEPLHDGLTWVDLFRIWQWCAPSCLPAVPAEDDYGRQRSVKGSYPRALLGISYPFPSVFRQ